MFYFLKLLDKNCQSCHFITRLNTIYLIQIKYLLLYLTKFFFY